MLMVRRVGATLYTLGSAPASSVRVPGRFFLAFHRFCGLMTDFGIVLPSAFHFGISGGARAGQGARANPPGPREIHIKETNYKTNAADSG